MPAPTSPAAPPPTGAPRPVPARIRLGQLWIDAVDLAGALAAIEALVVAGRGGAVFTPNVDHVITVDDDPELRAAYAAASLSLADGQLVVWGARLLGTPLPAKVSGSDLVWPLMALAGQRGWGVYLLGGAPGAAEVAGARLSRELGVRVVGIDAARIPLSAAPGVVDEALEQVRLARPDLVLVALGAPKQERWIHRSREGLGGAVALGVGASIDFLAGHARRAPAWMSRAGLEWLYRLAQEPRRLAHRYLVKGPRFLAVLARTARLPRAERTRPAGGRLTS